MLEIRNRNRYTRIVGMRAPDIEDRWGHRVATFTAEQVEDILTAVVRDLPMGIEWGDDEVMLASKMRLVLIDAEEEVRDDVREG